MALGVTVNTISYTPTSITLNNLVVDRSSTFNVTTEKFKYFKLALFRSATNGGIRYLYKDIKYNNNYVLGDYSETINAETSDTIRELNNLMLFNESSFSEVLELGNKYVKFGKNGNEYFYKGKISDIKNISNSNILDMSNSIYKRTRYIVSTSQTAYNKISYTYNNFIMEKETSKKWGLYKHAPLIKYTIDGISGQFNGHITESNKYITKTQQKNNFNITINLTQSDVLEPINNDNTSGDTTLFLGIIYSSNLINKNLIDTLDGDSKITSNYEIKLYKLCNLKTFYEKIEDIKKLYSVNKEFDYIKFSKVEPTRNIFKVGLNIASKSSVNQKKVLPYGIYSNNIGYTEQKDYVRDDTDTSILNQDGTRLFTEVSSSIVNENYKCNIQEIVVNNLNGSKFNFNFKFDISKTYAVEDTTGGDPNFISGYVYNKYTKEEYHTIPYTGVNSTGATVTSYTHVLKYSLPLEKAKLQTITFNDLINTSAITFNSNINNLNINRTLIDYGETIRVTAYDSNKNKYYEPKTITISGGSKYLFNAIYYSSKDRQYHAYWVGVNNASCVVSDLFIYVSNNNNVMYSGVTTEVAALSGETIINNTCITGVSSESIDYLIFKTGDTEYYAIRNRNYDSTSTHQWIYNSTSSAYTVSNVVSGKNIYNSSGTTESGTITVSGDSIGNIISVSYYSNNKFVIHDTFIGDRKLYCLESNNFSIDMPLYTFNRNDFIFENVNYLVSSSTVEYLTCNVTYNGDYDCEVYLSPMISSKFTIKKTGEVFTKTDLLLETPNNKNIKLLFNKNSKIINIDGTSEKLIKIKAPYYDESIYTFSLNVLNFDNKKYITKTTKDIEIPRKKYFDYKDKLNNVFSFNEFFTDEIDPMGLNNLSDTRYFKFSININNLPFYTNSERYYKIIVKQESETIKEVTGTTVVNDKISTNNTIEIVEVLDCFNMLNGNGNYTVYLEFYDDNIFDLTKIIWKSSNIIIKQPSMSTPKSLCHFGELLNVWNFENVEVSGATVVNMFNIFNEGHNLNQLIKYSDLTYNFTLSGENGYTNHFYITAIGDENNKDNKDYEDLLLGYIDLYSRYDMYYDNDTTIRQCDLGIRKFLNKKGEFELAKLYTPTYKPNTKTYSYITGETNANNVTFYNQYNGSYVFNQNEFSYLLDIDSPNLCKYNSIERKYELVPELGDIKIFGDISFEIISDNLINLNDNKLLRIQKSALLYIDLYDRCYNKLNDEDIVFNIMSETKSKNVKIKTCQLLRHTKHINLRFVPIISAVTKFDYYVKNLRMNITKTPTIVINSTSVSISYDNPIIDELHYDYLTYTEAENTYVKKDNNSLLLKSKYTPITEIPYYTTDMDKVDTLYICEKIVSGDIVSYKTSDISEYLLKIYEFINGIN